MTPHLQLDVMSKDTFFKTYPTLHYGNVEKWFAVMTPERKLCALGLHSFPQTHRLLQRYARHKLEERPLSLVDPLPCLLVGTPFQQKVWRALLNIPYGKTWSYQQLATHIAQPKAVRAVANAVGANPISPLIPCHRVVRNNGQLGGYYWGGEEKIKLLQEEGVSPFSKEDSSA